MKPAFIFHQYAWLVTTLRRRGRLTLGQINELWRDDEVSDGNPLSRSTFNRHRDAILNMFGVIVDCEKCAPYRYYIDNPEVLEEDSVERWMLSTLTVGGVLAGSASLHDRILLEDIPAGEEFLPSIMHAMRAGIRLSIEYCRFGGAPYDVLVSPYAIKLFQRRWYLVGDNGRKVATYSLDRVRRLEESEEEYEMPSGFDARRFFADYFGVITDGSEMQHVVAKVYGWPVDYLRTLPLHTSQCEVASGDDWAEFAFDVRLTPDFIDELLRYDAYVEVLQPQSLRDAIAERYATALSRYRP